MGGHKPNPTYNDISKGDSGHAEVIQLEYDQDVIFVRRIIVDIF